MSFLNDVLRKWGADVGKGSPTRERGRPARILKSAPKHRPSRHLMQGPFILTILCIRDRTTSPKRITPPLRGSRREPVGGQRGVP